MFMIDATLFPYTFIPSMMKIYIVLSLGDHKTYFPNTVFICK